MNSNLSLFDAVYDALQGINPDERDTAARHLLRHVDGGIMLLGIDDSQTRAVCFDPIEEVVYHVPVSRHGLRVPRAIIAWNDIDEPQDWIDANGHRLSSIHPRYRACLETERIQ